ncbi:HalOD1 output domain-containing protein [Natrialbaceae archaeon A-gly3]
MTPHTTSPANTDHYVVQYDRLDDEPLSVTVASAVASVTGLDVTELEPLHYTINTDALERLFEPRPNGLRTGGTVTFEYHDCTVTITADGEITVEPNH